MSDRREFIFRCEHMGGTTWTVEHQWAIEGEAEEVVRCRDCCCYHQTHEDGTGVCVRHQHGTAPHGYCAWGERRDTNGER